VKGHIAAPPGQPLIPAGQRGHVAGFCTRCDQLAPLNLSAGQDALCPACAGAETLDRALVAHQRTWRSPCP